MLHLVKSTNKLKTKFIIILLLISLNAKPSNILIQSNQNDDDIFYDFILNWYKKFVKSRYVSQESINQYFINAYILKDSPAKLNTQTVQGSLVEFLRKLDINQLNSFKASWLEAKSIRFSKKIIYISTKK